MNFHEVCKERVNGIVQQYPEGVTAAELCRRLIALGWAVEGVTPASIGLDDEDIIRLKR